MDFDIDSILIDEPEEIKDFRAIVPLNSAHARDTTAAPAAQGTPEDAPEQPRTGPQRPVSLVPLSEAAPLVGNLSREVRNQLCVLSRIILTMDRPITARAVKTLWPERATIFEFGFTGTVVASPSVRAIEAYFGTEDYLNKMAELGISFTSADDGLSSKQVAFLALVTDITDTKSLSTQMRKVGVTWTEFQAWQFNSEFREAFKKIGGDAVKAAIPLAELQLAGRMANGDQKAIEFGFALTGHFDPSRNKQVDAQKLFGLLLEIIEDEVKDPAVLARIGQRITASSAKAIE